MNNYNNLMNKPLVNGVELMGNVTISGLPAVTSADVGKVAIVGDDGKWTVGKISSKSNANNKLVGRITMNVSEVE